MQRSLPHCFLNYILYPVDRVDHTATPQVLKMSNSIQYAFKKEGHAKSSVRPRINHAFSIIMRLPAVAPQVQSIFHHWCESIPPLWHSGKLPLERWPKTHSSEIATFAGKATLDAGCKSVKHRLHPKRSEEVKGRVEICEANTTRP